MNPKTKTFLYSFLFLGLLGFCSFISLCIGPVSIPFKEFFNPSLKTIVWELRLHRILLAILVGGSLALSGNIFQIILRNPLADPYILGVSSAASFGATLAIILKLPFPAMPFLSLTIASFLILILHLAAKKHTGTSSHFLLLTGVLLSFLFSSLVVLCLSIAEPFEGAQLLFWLMGSLSQPLSKEILLISSVILLFLWGFAYTQSYSLNLLNLSDEDAQALGLSVVLAKKRFFLIASSMTALSVSLCGTIGFVGLIVPHFIRLVFGDDHRFTLPLSILCGGIFLIISDTLIRLTSTQEIPIGVITSLLGAPLFLILLWKKNI